MAALLIIVSRAEPTRYAYLKHVFGQNAEIVVDRRAGERRWRAATTGRRRADRRQRDINNELRALGWALVRR